MYTHGTYDVHHGICFVCHGWIRFVLFNVTVVYSGELHFCHGPFHLYYLWIRDLHVHAIDMVLSFFVFPFVSVCI